MVPEKKPYLILINKLADDYSNMFIAILCNLMYLKFWTLNSLDNHKNVFPELDHHFDVNKKRLTVYFNKIMI